VKAASGRVPIIGVGGIMSVADGKRKLDLGASLIQIYTGMLYRGPGFVGDLVRGLMQ
jgi:dihydroorotate dehydrogenase